jgi:gliding motility-associated-like protein
VVGNSFNLMNIRAGKFRLKFKDQGSCDTIITPYFVVKDTTAILINIANRKVVPAGCSFNNGSISNIIVSNANSYSWKNMNGNIPVGNTINIQQLSSSFYQLTATNSFGCSATSNGIYVGNASFDTINVADFTFKNAGCNNADGFIRINSFSKDAAKYTFRWIDSTNNRQLATGIAISALGKAVYTLMAADSNGCERKIFSHFIDSLPTPELNLSSMIITNEACGNKQGSITGIGIKNFIGPTSYEWSDSNNAVKGNELDLKNLSAGKYKLYVLDNGCGIATSLISISNNLTTGNSPVYNDIVITKNSPATFRVNNFEQGTYILYEDAAGTKELQRNTTGSFTTAPVTGNTNLYVQHVANNCISPLVKINITTVKSSFFTIAKAFTPNDDLVNNRLTVRVTGFININYFKIYNRFGQLVFETSKLNDSWDGKLNGLSQPVGAYIWIAEGKDITGAIIRDKGSIVLLR